MTMILAIDQGTSSTRAIIYSKTLEKIAVSQCDIQSSYPHSGWVEQDAKAIWESTLHALKAVMADIKGKPIAACGITNQRETVLIWDKRTSIPLANAIVWQDRRTQADCDALREHAPLLQRKTGLRLDAYFSAPKLKWLLDNTPNAREMAQQGHLAFGTIDSYLVWMLTKGQSHRTDVTNASRTLLFNIHQQRWDDELLALFDIPKSILPEVCASDGCYGDIDAQWFGQSIAITGVAGDQQAALVGQRCFHAGDTKATFGTGGFVMMNTGGRAVLSNHRLLTTIAYRMKGKTVYALEGSLYHAGTTIKWLCERMTLLKTPSESETLAKSLQSNEGVYLVSSFTGLAAPHWMDAKGAMMVGLSRQTTPAHFARAALEGVCYQTRELLTCMRKDSHLSVSALKVDGGMANNAWFLQFLSSQCKTIIQRPADVESTAKGAAMLAGLGAGVFPDLDTFAKHTVGMKKWNPQNTASVDEDFNGWLAAVSCLKNQKNPHEPNA